MVLITEPGVDPAEMILNVRAEISPADLEGLVRQRLDVYCARHALRGCNGQIRGLRLGRPEPTYRYDTAVT